MSSSVDNGSSGNSSFAADATLSSFYLYLSTAGFVPLLALLVGLRALIAGVGVVLNLDLVWITLRNKTLRGSCNFLIALYSFALAVYELGFFPMWVLVLSGQNLMRLCNCFWVMALPVLFKNFSNVMMVSIGLDRLKIVLFPWLPLQYEKYFVAFWTTLSGGFGVYIICISYVVMQRMPDTAVMCAASEVAQQEAGTVASNAAIYLTSASPAVYCILGLCFYFKTPKNSSQQGSRRFFKSIFVLMLIEFGGWGTNALFVLFFSDFFSLPGMSDLTKWSINTVFSYLLIMATAVNAPALYFCSSEYKSAFRAQFSALCHWKTDQTPVVPFTQGQQPRNPSKESKLFVAVQQRKDVKSAN